MAQWELLAGSCHTEWQYSPLLDFGCKSILCCVAALEGGKAVGDSSAFPVLPRFQTTTPPKHYRTMGMVVRFNSKKAADNTHRGQTMNLTFSLFGYFFSFQLFKNLFVPIERLDCQPKISSTGSRDDYVESECRQPGTGDITRSVT